MDNYWFRTFNIRNEGSSFSPRTNDSWSEKQVVALKNITINEIIAINAYGWIKLKKIIRVKIKSDLAIIKNKKINQN